MSTISWGYKLLGLLFLALGAIGVIYGVSNSNETLKYLGGVSMVMSAISEINYIRVVGVDSE